MTSIGNVNIKQTIVIMVKETDTVSSNWHKQWKQVDQNNIQWNKVIDKHIFQNSDQFICALGHCVSNLVKFQKEQENKPKTLHCY